MAFSGLPLLDQTGRDLRRLADALLRRHLVLGTAESCTGGLLAAALTDVPGSSAWFDCALVTYTLAAKQRLLGVSAATLQRWGAVSEPTARQMVEGLLARSSVDLGVAITGVAGPGGGDVTTPRGTVWFGWARRHEAQVYCQCHVFAGDRDAVRQQAVQQAVAGVLALLD